MQPSALQTILLLVLIAVVSAQSHGHVAGAHHKRVSSHRRHHAKAEQGIRSTRERRSCVARSGASSSSASASASASSATASASAAPAALEHSSSSTASASSSTHHSSSSSAAAPAETPAKPSTGISSDLKALLPISASAGQWTTSSASSSPLPLSDATLRPTAVLTALRHTYMQHAGKSAMQASYPAGSWNFQNHPQGGFSFYAPGPQDVDLSTAKEATFGYSVYFPEGFQFNLGGKLPGLYGGDSASGSISCSGGDRDNACFSSRIMWRPNGAGELYTYLPPAYAANDAVCNVAPYSDCNPTYGASVGRGSFTFATGAWTTVAMRVRLNDAGKQNGELQLWADGNSVINVGGLVLRDSDAGRIRGMMMQTFFGGSTKEWASPSDQEVYFADFSAAVTETL